MDQVLLKNGFIIDVVNGNHIRNGAILLSDGIIEKVGTLSDFNDLFEAREIDLQGNAVLPGMINVHVHLCLSGEAKPNVLQSSAIKDTINIINNAKKTLHKGVTTVRDCGCRNSAAIEVAKVIDQKEIEGPRVIACGNALLMTGGHGQFLGREVDGIDQLRKAAREEIKAGAKALKVVSTGGVLSPGSEIGSPELSFEEIAIVVEEAKKKNITVASHAIGATGILNSVRAGVDSIEHGSYITDEAIELMKEKGTYHIPTLTAYYCVVENSSNGMMEKSTVEKARMAYEVNLQSFIRSRAQGVNFAVGTDAGTPFNYHGSVLTELKLMTEIGVSNFEALQAATIYGAELLKIKDQVGSIEAGKKADLVVVRGNPLENLESLNQIQWIFKEGEIVDRPTERGEIEVASHSGI